MRVIGSQKGDSYAAIRARLEAEREAQPMTVSASRLSPENKRRVWEHLKANAPERVAFLTDPVVRRLVEQGGSPVFTVDELRAAGVMEAAGVVL